MQPTRDNDFTPHEDVLAVGLELSGKSWKIALSDGKHDKPAIYTISDEAAAARLAHAMTVMKQVLQKWELSAQTRIAVIYEAGQDGFWISRALSACSYQVLVVDPTSIPVARQARRAKTDRLDAIRLLQCLRAWLRGERDQMHIVMVPSVQDEAQRHLVRDRGELQKEVVQHRDRIRKLLRTVGCWNSVEGDFRGRLAQDQVRCYDGTALPALLQERLARECERLALAEQQFQELEATLMEQLSEQALQRVANLMKLKAVGAVGAMRLVLELYWRDFDNRKQVGSCVGLVPQPYDSGDSRVDQGISKQGNRRVRALLIEMAWFWLRYQPHSALSQWFMQRTQGSGPNKRARRIAIVAVARRLAIALWRYLTTGEIPAGAEMKTA